MLRKICLIAGCAAALSACAASSTEPAANPKNDPPKTLIPYLAADGRYGYVDRFAASDGVLVLPAVYGDAGMFSEGRAAVASAEGGAKYPDWWGYIDEQGRWIVKPKFTNAGPFHNGKARASISVESTRRGSNGYAIIEFPDLNPFHHGAYSINYLLNADGHVLTTKRSDNYYGYDTSPPSADEATAKKRAARCANNVNCYALEYMATPCEGYSIDDKYDGFKDGYAAVTSPGHNGLAVIDQQCRLVVPFRGYVEMYNMSKGFFAAQGKKGWGIVDAARDVEVIPLQYKYNDVRVFNRNSATTLLGVKNDAKRWNLLDAGGKLLCGGFTDIWDAEENAVVVTAGNDRKGAISSDGTWLFKPRPYNLGFSFHDGLAYVAHELSGPYFFIEKNGREFRAGGRAAEPAGVGCGS
jgi:hypothetical protein